MLILNSFDEEIKMNEICVEIKYMISTHLKIVRCQGNIDIIIIIIIINIFIAHSYQFKIASEALKVCKRL